MPRTLRRRRCRNRILLALLLALGVVSIRGEAAEDITLEAEDGRSIAATLHLPEGEGGKAPAVLLIQQEIGPERHQESQQGEWAPFIPPLVARGYAVLVYDVQRDDPGQALLDLEAAVVFLRDHPAVDELRIAVVGSSTGADLAVLANHQYGLPGVAISGETSETSRLAGPPSELDLQGMFYLSSDGDQAGRRAAWAREMVALTAEPRQLWIVEGSSAHGVALFEDSPVSFERLLRWLKARLKSGAGG